MCTPLCFHKGMTLETRMIVDPVLELAAEEVHKAETPSTDGPYAALL